jgi:hypothetical protein
MSQFEDLIHGIIQSEFTEDLIGIHAIPDAPAGYLKHMAMPLYSSSISIHKDILLEFGVA